MVAGAAPFADDNLFRGDKYKWSLRLTSQRPHSRIAIDSAHKTVGHELREKVEKAAVWVELDSTQYQVFTKRHHDGRFVLRF